MLFWPWPRSSPAAAVRAARPSSRRRRQAARRPAFVLAATPEPERVAERLEKLGGLTKWAELGRFTVDEERAVEIGGCPMTRRIVRVDFKGSRSTYISVRAVRNGKLYLFVGFTDSEHFDALLPEFEQAISSFRIG